MGSRSDGVLCVAIGILVGGSGPLLLSRNLSRVAGDICIDQTMKVYMRLRQVVQGGNVLERPA